MTKFAFEVPIPHLWDFHLQQDFLFGLSFLCKVPEYREYLNLTKQDLHFVLDNSYNELQAPQTPTRMTELWDLFKPNLVVAPDTDWWTAEAALDAYKQVGVHHSAKLALVKDEYEYNLLERAGCFNFAASYYWRPEMSQRLKEKCAYWFGLTDLDEFKEHKPKYLDTGMPIKLAMLEVSWKDWVAEGCPHIHSKGIYQAYFKCKMSQAQVQEAKDNIKRLKEACHGNE